MNSIQFLWCLFLGVLTIYGGVVFVTWEPCVAHWGLVGRSVFAVLLLLWAAISYCYLEEGEFWEEEDES